MISHLKPSVLPHPPSPPTHPPTATSCTVGVDAEDDGVAVVVTGAGEVVVRRANDLSSKTFHSTAPFLVALCYHC